MISLTGSTMNLDVRRAAIIALFLIAIVLNSLSTPALAQTRRPVRHGAICGDPTAACKTSASFQPNDLPFRIPERTVIYDTELFYAVILESISAPDDNCDIFVSESDRLAAEALFPNHRVFASRCAGAPELSYTNTNPNERFMAVFAGLKLAEANSMLAAVKATGKYPGANVRRMRAAFNGT